MTTEKHYTDIKSNFVRNKLKMTAWRGRKYIDDLLIIEDLVLSFDTISGTERFYAGLIFSGLRRRYLKEYYAILKELNPAKFRVELQRDRVHKEMMKKLNEETKLKVKTDKENWLKAGGRK